jgi:hypothetical protein
MINSGSSAADVANIKTAAQNAAANIAVDTRAILGVMYVFLLLETLFVKISDFYGTALKRAPVSLA